MTTKRYGEPTKGRALPTDAGCWIDGHWGQYATDRLLEIAGDLGFSPADQRDRLLLDYSRANAARPSWDESESVMVALRLLLPLASSDDERISQEWQIVEECYGLADDVLAWLNEYVAPDGYSFDWADGELMLWPEEDWQSYGAPSR